MSDSSNAITEALYDKFLLRDVFGKIAPGYLLLFVSISAIFPEFYYKISTHIDWKYIALLIPVAWLTSLIIQSLGERTNYISLWPSKYNDNKFRYELRNSFNKIATPQEKQQASRYELISESSGIFGATCALMAIGFLAIGINSLVYKHLYYQCWRHFLISGLLVMSSVLLKLHHNLHTLKRYNFYESVNKPNGETYA